MMCAIKSSGIVLDVYVGHERKVEFREGEVEENHVVIPIV